MFQDSGQFEVSKLLQQQLEGCGVVTTVQLDSGSVRATVKHTVKKSSVDVEVTLCSESELLASGQDLLAAVKKPADAVQPEQPGQTQPQPIVVKDFVIGDIVKLDNSVGKKLAGAEGSVLKITAKMVTIKFLVLKDKPKVCANCEKTISQSTCFGRCGEISQDLVDDH